MRRLLASRVFAPVAPAVRAFLRTPDRRCSSVGESKPPVAETFVRHVDKRTMPGYTVDGRPLQDTPFNLKEILSKIDASDLKLGDDLPPMLQHNEPLVEAGLALLDVTQNMKLDPEDEEALVATIEMLFSETFVPVPVQYCIAEKVLHREKLRSVPKIVEAVNTIFEFTVPRPVHAALVAIDFAAFNEDQLHAWNAFILQILKGDAEEEAFLATLKALEEKAPHLFQVETFVVLLRNLQATMLQTRLYFLLTETCRAFDPESTGKIKLADLRASLEKVVDVDTTNQMVDGVETDADGCVFYPQMASILMRHSG